MTKNLLNVTNAHTNVKLVKMMKTNVLFVPLTELELQIVVVQMVSMMTELMLNVNHVASNVLLVIKMDVLLVLLTELSPQLVVVMLLKDITTKEKLNVQNVTTNVPPVPHSKPVQLVLETEEKPNQTVHVQTDTTTSTETQFVTNVPTNVKLVQPSTPVSSVLNSEPQPQPVHVKIPIMKKELNVSHVHTNVKLVLTEKPVPFVLKEELTYHIVIVQPVNMITINKTQLVMIVLILVILVQEKLDSVLNVLKTELDYTNVHVHMEL